MLDIKFSSSNSNSQIFTAKFKKNHLVLSHAQSVELSGEVVVGVVVEVGPVNSGSLRVE